MSETEETVKTELETAEVLNKFLSIILKFQNIPNTNLS